MDVDVGGLDGGKFSYMKQFVVATREFNATHSDTAANLLSRYLGLITSTCDLSLFSPGRSEVCSFFNCLWEVMSHPDGPLWAGVAALTKAAREPTCRHSLIHTYRFMPILSKMLSDTVALEKKIRLLTLMQDLSYGIKITWQESYLPQLLKQLCDYILMQSSDATDKLIAEKALSLLVNLCYGNLPAVYVLMRTVDTRELFKFLVNMSESGGASVQVCRLMVALQSSAAGSNSLIISTQQRVHGYLATTLQALQQAVKECDHMQPLYVKTFLNDLSADPILRPHLLTYTGYNAVLKEILKIVELYPEQYADLAASPGQEKRLKEHTHDEETWTQCLHSLLLILLVLVKLEIDCIKPLYSSFIDLGIRCARVGDCLGPSLALHARIVLQFRGDLVLPEDILASLYIGVTGLLVPPTLKPTRTGLEWLQFLEALCYFKETCDTILHHVIVEQFEETLYSILQHCSESGASALTCGQVAALSSCTVCVELSIHSDLWNAALQRILSNNQIQKMLSSCLAGDNGSRRKDVLRLIKHRNFPEEKISPMFGQSDSIITSASVSAMEVDVSDDQRSMNSIPWNPTLTLAPGQENSIDELISKLNNCFEQNKVSDIATSSVMELYGYKMSCMEQRLQSYSTGLQGATEHMSTLQRTMALLQATNSSQQDVLYQIQSQNEKLKDTVAGLNQQQSEAKNSLRVFKAKLTAERVDKVNQLTASIEKYNCDIAHKDGEIESRNKQIFNLNSEKEEQQQTIEKLQVKLEQQVTKNSELASVLSKFEERVKQRDKRLEEASQAQSNLRKENDHLTQTIKSLEKTVLERDNRLSQVTSQLEEMKRVQEMVAKLMAGNKNNVPTLGKTKPLRGARETEE